MADIVLDKNAPDYKEKLTEKRRILMAKTRQIKKDNSLVKKENHKKTVEENKINRINDKQLFKEWKLNQSKKSTEDIVNADTDDKQEEQVEEVELEVEEIKTKQVIKPKLKQKPKKQVIIEESESERESDSEEEEIIIVKKPKKKEPKQKIIYVEREPPTVKRQIVKPLQELQEQQVEKPAKIDYSKYFNLK